MPEGSKNSNNNSENVNKASSSNGQAAQKPSKSVPPMRMPDSARRTKSSPSNRHKSKTDRDNANNAQAVKQIANLAEKAPNPYVKAAGTAVSAADKVTGGKASDTIGKAMTRLNKNRGLMGKLTQKFTNSMSERLNGTRNKSVVPSTASMNTEAEGNKEEQTVDNEERSNQTNPKSVSNIFTAAIKNMPITVKLTLIMIAAFIAVNIIILAPILSNDTVQKIIANKHSTAVFDDSDREDDSDKSQWDEENKDDINNWSDEHTGESAILLNKNFKLYAKADEFIDDDGISQVTFVVKTAADVDLSKLKENYKIDCSGDDCEKTNIYRFYRKMYDIFYLYKYKYQVRLDLALLMSTLNYNSISQDKVFTRNLNDYNIDEVRADDYNNSNITNLDWEYDFKNIPGYTYLNANDFRYDMQILAKNMVTKQISYKCGDNTKKAKDIETVNYDKALTCDNGQYDSSSVSATYKLDLDKYDDFLLEYLEHKNYLKGSEVSKTDDSTITGQTGSVKSNSLADAMVKFAINEVKTNKANNPTKYLASVGLGVGNPWCASFVSYVSLNAKYNGKTVNDIVKFTSASTGAFMNHFANSSHLKFYLNPGCSSHTLAKSYTPKPGDYIMFSNARNSCNSKNPSALYGCHDHIGIVEKSSGGKVYTIEGNTGNGVLAQNSYSTSDCRIVGYGSWY